MVSKMGFQVVFIHGPAAAGKYTIGAQVAERLGWPLFHNHLTVDLVKTLFDFGSAEFVRLREEIWRASFAAAARARQSFVFTFNPEATVRPALIAELADTVEQHGGQLRYVELRCSDDEVARRIANPSRAKFGKLVDPALFREIVEQGGFDFPPLPEPLIAIDTERMAPHESADAIVGALDRAPG